MELDAPRREPNLNLSAQEFQWQRNTKRCLKWAKTGHMIRECRNPKDARDSTSLWKVGNTETNTWRNIPTRIQEMEVEKDKETKEESGKDENSQERMVSGVDRNENPSSSETFMQHSTIRNCGKTTKTM